MIWGNTKAEEEEKEEEEKNKKEKKKKDGGWGLWVMGGLLQAPVD